MRAFPIIAMATVLTSACNKQAKVEYPVAPCDSTTYEAFGMTVEDPYRPLENDTAAVLTNQNKIAEKHFMIQRSIL